MKKFLQTTLTALLISAVVFAQSEREQATNSSLTNTANEAAQNQLLLLGPSDGHVFDAKGSGSVSKPVLFRWTAVIPKPNDAVTYRLKVWQIMQGQNATEAMRNNQPIVTKEVVNITQAAVNNLYTGPCKPPYLCDFVWAVEAFIGDDITLGKPYGASDNYSFNFGADGQNDIDKESDNFQSTKAVDKRIDKSAPTIKNLIAQGDPVHGVDVKLGTKSSKETQPTAFALYLPIEIVVYDTKGNITGIMIKTEKGESAFVKVVVAGSNSLSGGYSMLKTEKGEPIIAKVVMAESNSLSGAVK